MTTSTYRQLTLSETSETPNPAYPDIRPQFKVLSSSHNLQWNNLHLSSYWLAPQPSFVPAPQGDFHIIQFGIDGGYCNLSAKMDGRIERSFIAPGSIVVTPFGTTTSTSWDKEVNVCHVYLSPKVLVNAASEIGRSDPERVELLWRLGAPDQLMEQMGLALLRELHTQNSTGRLYVESLTQTLAVHLLHHHSTLSRPRKPRMGALPPSQLNLVIEYIHEYIETDISLANLAELVDLSSTYFSKRFRLATDLAPYQYVIQCRVERAKALLVDDEYTITEIASKVGFTDHSHLNRHFKRLFGVPPSEFRRQSKNVHQNSKNVQAIPASPSVK